MKVIVADHFGICFGVRDAIAQAHALARKGPLTILGELVHNPIVREQLRSQGIQEGPSANAANSRVMITAHGTSDKQREALNKRGLEVADGGWETFGDCARWDVQPDAGLVAVRRG